VAEVGPSITAFNPGDRVLRMVYSFSSGNNDHAAFQNYTVVKATSAALLPQTMSFKQGATLPTAVGIATIALFDVLGFPRPLGATIPQAS
jgi:NADPH:quinone reductase-like Zn-dependent oxidoreductase